MAPHDFDVAQGDPFRAADREVGVADPVRGEAGAVERHPGGGERRVGLGFDGLRLADAVAAVVVEPDAERPGEFRRVGDHEVDRLIEVERERVLDVERKEGADDAGSATDVARLEGVPATVHEQFRAGDAQRAGDVLARPLEFDDVAGLAAVRRRARSFGDRSGGAGREEADRGQHGEQPHATGVGAHRSYTMRPPTTVSSISIDSRHGSSHCSTWSAVTTRSAAMPTSSVPFSASSKVR